MDLKNFRREIDEIDDAIIELIAKRFSVVGKIGVYKKENNIQIADKKRQAEKIKSLSIKANEKGVSKKLVERLWELIFKEALEIEKKF